MPVTLPPRVLHVGSRYVAEFADGVVFDKPRLGSVPSLRVFRAAFLVILFLFSSFTVFTSLPLSDFSLMLACLPVV